MLTGSPSYQATSARCGADVSAAYSDIEVEVRAKLRPGRQHPFGQCPVVDLVSGRKPSTAYRQRARL